MSKTISIAAFLASTKDDFVAASTYEVASASELVSILGLCGEELKSAILALPKEILVTLDESGKTILDYVTGDDLSFIICNRGQEFLDAGLSLSPIKKARNRTSEQEGEYDHTLYAPALSTPPRKDVGKARARDEIKTVSIEEFWSALDITNFVVPSDAEPTTPFLRGNDLSFGAGDPDSVENADTVGEKALGGLSGIEFTDTL